MLGTPVAGTAFGAFRDCMRFLLLLKQMATVTETTQVYSLIVLEATSLQWVSLGKIHSMDRAGSFSGSRRERFLAFGNFW